MAERKSRPAPLEWVAASIGLAIFIGLFAILFARALNDDKTHTADLTVENHRMVATPTGTRVTFDVRNRSGQTAAAVQIKGRLLEGGSEVESSEVTLDYVPARSRVRAGLMFSEAPHGRRVEVHAVGYREP